ncbi:MAG TPA: hypothetical protein VG755_45795, partial [Nannocystaceae bacterium]|nr:hypothetical protein [Nannocystaceae bacterium]
MANDEEEMQAEVVDDGEDRDAVDLQEMGDRALQLVQRQATQHPLRTVGIAMGVGYVLGGGVPKLFVRLGMIAAGRALSRAATIEGMRVMANMLRGHEDEPAAEEAPTAAPPTSERRNGHRRKR